MATRLTGGCLCGSVRYVLQGPLRPVVACHCKMCRRLTGHFFAGTQVHTENLLSEEDESLTWYQSSAEVRRGFCSRCGSTLFFQRSGTGRTTVAAGTLDEPTGLRLVQHIFARHAGDYYTIDDALPKYDEHGEMPGLEGEQT
ncbi:MAG: GFA family protein [Halofilum sp. (in: g-proteobacteria)]|nr:GFA family protein [Halofilum sp. (in: g-proteobacteria)]